MESGFWSWGLLSCPPWFGFGTLMFTGQVEHFQNLSLFILLQLQVKFEKIQFSLINLDQNFKTSDQNFSLFCKCI